MVGGRPARGRPDCKCTAQRTRRKVCRCVVLDRAGGIADVIERLDGHATSVAASVEELVDTGKELARNEHAVSLRGRERDGEPWAGSLPQRTGTLTLPR